MAILTALLEVILPVALVASVGVALSRSFHLEPDTVGKINLYGLTPALAFNSVMTTQVSGGQAAHLVIGYLVVSLAVGLIALLAALPYDGKTRRGVIACVVIGNNGNFGLPIALLALGQEGLDQAVVLFLISLVVMFIIGPALLGAHKGLLGAMLTVVKLPVTWALVLALVIRLSGFTLPVGITRGVELLAGAAVPMVLLALGIQLGQSQRIHFTRPVLTAVGLRVFVLPLLALGLGVAIGLRGLELSSLILACSMPTAVNVFMIAREYGSDPETAASAVALSTVVSLGTIAVAVALLPGLG